MTDFKESKSSSVKLPVTTKAPPTVFSLSKPLILCKSLLLATTKPPPTSVKLEQYSSVKSSLDVTAKVPPTLAKEDMFKDVTELLIKPKEALTFCKDAKEAELTSLKVTLLAQTRLSKVTLAPLPFEENSKELETVFKVDFKFVKYLLLLKLKVAASSKDAKAFTDSKAVSEM